MSKIGESLLRGTQEPLAYARGDKKMKVKIRKVNSMPKKAMSTFEREMKNPRFKKAFEKCYQELLLSELLTALMDDDEKSVRSLAKEAKLPPTVIQNLRSGDQDNVKVSHFVSIVGVCGYKVVLEKGQERIEVKHSKRGKHHLNFIHVQ
jgi:hypothetical protein